MSVYDLKEVSSTCITLSSANEGQISIPTSDIAFTYAHGDKSTLVYLSFPEDSTSTAVPALHVVSVVGSVDQLGRSIAPQNNRKLNVIINLAAGAGRGGELLEKVLKPMFQIIGLQYTVYETKGVDDAGRIGRELVTDAEVGEKTDVAIIGGDGTVHELLNGVLLDENSKNVKSSLELVLLPFGTANALYYHLEPPEATSTPSTSSISSLYSLLAYLRREPARLTPLSLARNATTSSPKPVITSVVTSAALHAAILYDAEELRASMPGVERFKVAAQKNASVWTEGTLTLSSSGVSQVEKYNPLTKKLEPVSDSLSTLKGPFLYLATSLVSRFESNFIVAPLRSPLSPSAPTTPSVDVILIRPTRGYAPGTVIDQEMRESFVGKVWQVTGGMYNGGTHIDVLYEGTETPIVEYFRCGSFEWTPAESENSKASLICLDGSISSVGAGGSLKSEALPLSEANVKVWS